MAQTFVKSSPGFRTEPSGMVTSPSNTLLLHASPSEAVACLVGRTATGVLPGMGVLAGVPTNENVGRAATLVVGVAAPDRSSVGRATVARVVTVAAGAVVFVGAACAVCVSSTESCATVVPTRAVLRAFTSVVGAGAAPTLQDAK